MIRLVLIVALSVSACGSQAQDAHSPMERPSAEQPKIDGEQGPTETVRNLLKLVSSGEKKQADALFSKSMRPARPEVSPAPNSALVEVPATFDWVGYLSEREWIFKRVLSERIDKETALIEAELGVAYSEQVVQKAIFKLQREGGKWLIVDMEFTFDNPK